MLIIEDFQMLIENYLTKVWWNEKKLYFSSPNIVRKKLEKTLPPIWYNFYFFAVLILGYQNPNH